MDTRARLKRRWSNASVSCSLLAGLQHGTPICLCQYRRRSDQAEPRNAGQYIKGLAQRVIGTDECSDGRFELQDLLLESGNASVQ